MGCKESKPIKKDIKQKLDEIKSQVEEKALDLIASTINSKIPINQSLDIRAIRDQMKNQLIEKDYQIDMIRRDNDDHKKKIIELESSMVKKIIPKKIEEDNSVIIQIPSEVGK